MHAHFRLIPTLALIGVPWLASAQAGAGACSATAAGASRRGAAPWTSWGADASNSRYQARPGLRTADIPRLRLAWAYRLGDVSNARSQPAVHDGRIFVGSESGTLVALDAATGCRHWEFKADAPVRSGIAVEPATAAHPTLLIVGDVAGQAYAVDAATGTLRWKVRVDPHFAAIVTGTPQLHAGMAYVPVSSYESALPLQPTYECCTFRGSVVALDVLTGAKQWQAYTIDEPAVLTGTRSASGARQRGPSGAAVWSSPTVDVALDRVYFGTGNNYSDPASPRSDAVIAVDRLTGRVVWSRQFAAGDGYNVSCDMPGKYNCPLSDGPDADIGQPPMLVSLGGGRRALLVGQKSGVARAIDPDHEGAVLWERKLGAGGRLGGLHWGSATDGATMFVAFGGQQMSAVPDTSLKEGYHLEADPRVGGGLFALDVKTGAVRWSAPPVSCGDRPRCSPAQSAPVTAIPGVVFSAALDGHLRAYDAHTGSVLWDFDTVRDFDAVNGGRARGGAIDVAGPIISGGMVYTLSGYAQYGALAGNVLLAFSRDGK